MYAYTEEQAKQAIHDKKIKDCIKAFELVIHERAKIEQVIYNLPYKVMLDYLHRERDPFEIPLNYYYPFPGNKKPCTKAPEQSAEKVIDFSGVIDTDSDRDIDSECEGIRCIYDVDTEQGQQAWLYHFAVYILPYADKIPNFTMFEMYGDVTATDQDLDNRKRYYMDMIQRCIDDPGIYEHKIPRKHITDYDTYDVGMGYMWDNVIGVPPTAPNTDKDTALAILHKELEVRQAYYTDDLLGVIEFEDELEIIQDLITELETGVESKLLAEQRELVQRKHDTDPLWIKLDRCMAICNPVRNY